MTGRNGVSGDDNKLSPAANVPELSHAERESVERQSRANAALIHETIRAEGLAELQRSSFALAMSGFAAGLSMGFSLITEALIKARLPDAPWAELVSRLGYSMGFLIVVLGRQQLFTENTLTPVLPILHKRSLRAVAQLARLWIIVLAANIAGAWCVAAALAHTGALRPPALAAAQEIARHSAEGGAWLLFVRGIFAGWLIALMVWLLPAVESNRPPIVLLVTYVIALGGFAHIIAGSIDQLYLRELGEISWRDYFAGFFAPVLAGNTLGGVALVAGLNYGQVASEVEH
jgi:formate-nitrite transporter family protein